jgi:hypothetical protein
VRGFRQKFTLEDAIGSHACSLEANTRVTNGIHLGTSLLLPVDTVNCVQTLKVLNRMMLCDKRCTDLLQQVWEGYDTGDWIWQKHHAAALAYTASTSPAVGGGGGGWVGGGEYWGGAYEDPDARLARELQAEEYSGGSGEGGGAAKKPKKKK